MNNHLLRAAATLASLAAIRTLPQAIAVSVAESAMTASVAASVTGKWFHEGATSYEARVPVRTLSMVDGKVTPETGTMQALNSQSQR